MADTVLAQPMGTTGGGIDWSQLLSGLGSAGLDIWSLISGKPQAAASQAANIANPLIPAQGQALGQLQQFLTDPSSVLKDPAFLAAENLGAENVSRQYGARNMASSGNRMADLFKFGQTAGLGYEQQRFNQLLEVLRPSPAAADLYLGGQQGKQNTIADLLKQLVGGVGMGGGLVGMLPSIIRTLTGDGGITGDLTGSGLFGDIAGTGGMDWSTIANPNEDPFGIDMSTIDPGNVGIINDIFSSGSDLGQFDFSSIFG